MDRKMRPKKLLEDRTPLLVLLIGLALTGISTWGARESVIERDRLRFELSIEAVEENLHDKLDLYLGVTWATVGLFQSSGLDVTPEEFRTFRLAADWGERNKGLAGIVFVQKVNPSRRKEFEAKHQVATPWFRIHPEPSSDDHELYAVTHLEPPAPERMKALGFNPFTESSRRRALETAATTGRAAVTDRIVLQSDHSGEDKGAILLYAPTYLPGAESLPQSQRSPFLYGFVGVAFYLDGFLSHIRRGPAEQQIGFQIASNQSHTILGGTGNPEDSPNRLTRIMSVPGATWSITYWTLPEFQSTSSVYQVPLVAITGLLLSLALYSLAVVQSKARKAQELALFHEIERARDLEEQDSAKTRFFSNLNHELRTPLNGILGMSDLLYDTNLDARQQEYLKSIGACGKALLDLIGDALDLSKINAGKMELQARPCSSKVLFSQALEVVRGPALGKDVELVFDWDEEIPETILVDSVKLRQVLINLLGNAVKFTEKGRVTLRVTATHVNQSFHLCFEIQDTGIGIAKEDARKLFRPFSQINNELTTSETKGTGLGLHLCRELLTLMGGTIELESVQGEGATFRCWLPIEKSESNPYETQTIDDAESQLKRTLSILVVDDNPINRRVLGLQLDKMGHEVEMAAGGEEAVKLTLEHDYELVLMDCQMPGMDGLEATRRIRAEKGESPVIVALTAFTEESQRRACMDAGMNEFLTKPVDADMLRNVLDNFSRDLSSISDSDQ
jgi:signal transduction histidine kinase/CheY-like chemotaxis protein